MNTWRNAQTDPPEWMKRVLLYIGHEIVIGYRCGDHWTLQHYKGVDNPNDIEIPVPVTHWQPLPDPPEVG